MSSSSYNVVVVVVVVVAALVVAMAETAAVLIVVLTVRVQHSSAQHCRKGNDQSQWETLSAVRIFEISNRIE